MKKPKVLNSFSGRSQSVKKIIKANGECIVYLEHLRSFHFKENEEHLVTLNSFIQHLNNLNGSLYKLL